jgi:enoyl-CoA hydratase
VAELSLEPPEGKPPTLDHAVLDALDAAVADLETKPPRLVVLRSASDRFFCVGANINVLQDTNEQTIGPWVEHGHRVVNRVEDLPCPVIARVEGYALGGGLELALACDAIYASHAAQLGLTEASLGFIPGWGGCHRLAQRIGPSAAKHAFFVGRIFQADHAMRIGLVDFVGDTQQLDEAISNYARLVDERSVYAIQTFKSLINDEFRAARERNLDAERSNSVGCLRDPQTKQRLQAFLSRKK